MLSKLFLYLISLTLILCLISQSAFAMRGSPFYIPINQTDNDETLINLSKHHYTVEVVGGKISSKDNLADTIFNRNSTLIGSYKQTIEIPGSSSISLNKLFQDEDISNRIDRPIQTFPLLEKIPGDYQTGINIRFVVNRDKRLSEVISALEKEQESLAATGTEVLSSPWVSYAKIATRILELAFNAGRDKYPIEWDGRVQVSDVTSQGKMKPHYLALIAPRKDGDIYFNSFTTNNLSVSGNKLLINKNERGVSLTTPIEVDRTYILIKVSKAENFNIAQMINNSPAAWANFGRKQIIGISDNNITADEVKVLSDSLLNQLKGLNDLLIEEVKFSAYDKAVALIYFSNGAKQRISTVCSRLNIAEANCPTSAIDAYAVNFATTNGISVQDAKTAASNIR